MGGVFIEKNILYAIFPLDLIQNENYSFLSCEEKLLYMLLLNRANISAKNTKIFKDDKGVFVFYSNKQIQNHLHCSNKTAIKLLTNLESAGLIRKEYQKNGLPLKIYVNDVFGMHNRTYNRNVSQPKPPDKPEPQYKNDFKSHSHIVNKEKSYDMDKIDEMTHNHLFTFAEKKKKRKPD